MYQNKIGTYLEDFLDRVGTLPSQVKRELALMGELDKDSSALLQEIKDMQRQYVAKAKRRVAERRGRRGNLAEVAEDKPALDALEAKRAYAVQRADEKVNISHLLYGLIDQHIRKLDVDLQQFETALTESGALPAYTASSRSASQRGSKRSSAAMKQPVEVAPVEQVVDPNEPLYCTCQRPYFGDMIGCDNEACPIEWFHFECVGLKVQPTGKWYCPDCTVKMKRSRR